jgi:glycosyltransferase involved in cell wall biosynthesis
LEEPLRGLTPAVSIIIPTFNRPGHLRECLQSIAAQTFSDWEAIVINDAGEPVERVAAEFGQHRLRVIHLPAKRGQVAARKRGVEIARGKYIAFCDDDDLWLPAHLGGLVDVLDAGAGLAYSDAEIVVFENAGQGRVPVRREEFAFDYDPWLLRHWNFIPPSTAAYPRDLHEQLGTFDEAMEDYWDWDWWLRIDSRYPVRHVPVASALLGVDADGENASADLARMAPNLARLTSKHGLGPLPTSNFMLMLREPELQAWRKQNTEYRVQNT